MQCWFWPEGPLERSLFFQGVWPLPLLAVACPELLRAAVENRNKDVRQVGEGPQIAPRRMLQAVGDCAWPFPCSV